MGRLAHAKRSQEEIVSKIFLHFAALAALAVSPLLGVDGVILIDQNRALAGNVTPGDAPGFPITITKGGSYRLSGDITVPDVNTTAIVLETGDPLTIDFNGFAILGPDRCDGPVLGCFFSGNGVGIDTGEARNASGVQIWNGTISGMGSFAISLVGFGNTVRDMRIRHNGRGGIVSSGIITKNIVELNGGPGISTFEAVIDENFVSQNFDLGILAFRGTVSNNYVSHNKGFGLQSFNTPSNNNTAIPNAGYKGNFFADNNSGGAQTSGGTPLGPNICGTGLCP